MAAGSGVERRESASGTPSELLLRLAVLVLVFEGDAAAWADHLAREGSERQRRDDLAFARALASRCINDRVMQRYFRLLGRRFVDSIEA